MGKTKPADGERGDLLGEMSAGQRKTFARLEALLAEADHDFAWHHRLGRLLLELREGKERLPPGWVGRLARALGRSASLLTKSVAFARGYAEKEVAALERTGAGWDRFVQTLAVPGKRRRLQLLRAARGQGLDWLRRRVRKAKGGPAHAGGRPRRALGEGQASQSVQELLGLSRRWLAYAREAPWRDDPPALFSRLRQQTPAGGDAELVEALGELNELLRRMGEAVSRLRKALPRLFATLKRRARRRPRA